MTTEEWKLVKSLTNKITFVEASNLGNIRVNGKVRKQSLVGKYYKVGRGYNVVRIKGRLRYVNRMVCEAFHGKPPSRRHFADHQDEVTTNNHSDNLKWVTHLKNTRLHFQRKKRRSVCSHRKDDCEIIH